VAVAANPGAQAAADNGPSSENAMRGSRLSPVIRGGHLAQAGAKRKLRAHPRE
jgi:hypothetical protein